MEPYPELSDSFWKKNSQKFAVASATDQSLVSAWREVAWPQ
jgi:hypothetical protein